MNDIVEYCFKRMCVDRQEELKKKEKELADLKAVTEARVQDLLDMTGKYNDLKAKHEKFLEADRKYCGNTRGALGETLQELADLKEQYEQMKMLNDLHKSQRDTLKQLVGELLDECSMGKEEGWVQPPSLFILDKLKQAIGKRLAPK